MAWRAGQAVVHTVFYLLEHSTAEPSRSCRINRFPQSVFATHKRKHALHGETGRVDGTLDYLTREVIDAAE